MIPKRGIPFLALALLALPAAACAGAPPDSAGLVSLQSACDDAPQVRVTTRTSVFLAHRPQVSADGFTIPAPAAPQALITIGDTGAHARVVPWSEIERLESEHSRRLASGLTGALVGAALGSLAVAVNGPDAFEEGDNGMVAYAMVLTVGFGLTGMLIGTLNPRLQHLYP